MAASRPRIPLRLILTPVSIVLAAGALLFVCFPYTYFSGGAVANGVATIFPVALLVLLPIDVGLRLLCAGAPRRLWLLEGAVLLGAAVFVLTLT